MSMHRYVVMTMLGLLLSAAGCGDSRQPAADAPPAAAGAAAPVRTAAAPANACGWIPAADAAAILGPLEGEPTVVRSLEQPDPDERGGACRYALAAKPRVGIGAVVLEVDLSGALIRERVGDNMAEGFRRTIQSDIAAAGVLGARCQSLAVAGLGSSRQALDGL